jgi:hypothetical protein
MATLRQACLTELPSRVITRRVSCGSGGSPPDASTCVPARLPCIDTCSSRNAGSARSAASAARPLVCRTSASMGRASTARFCRPASRGPRTDGARTARRNEGSSSLSGVPSCVRYQQPGGTRGEASRVCMGWSGGCKRRSSSGRPKGHTRPKTRQQHRTLAVSSQWRRRSTAQQPQENTADMQ